jgi:hypothetical protein
MCNKCAELDERIRHYRGIASRITDQRTIDGIKRLIADMEAKKKVLHPEQPE